MLSTQPGSDFETEVVAHQVCGLSNLFSVFAGSIRGLLQDLLLGELLISCGIAVRGTKPTCGSRTRMRTRASPLAPPPSVNTSTPPTACAAQRIAPLRPRPTWQRRL